MQETNLMRDRLLKEFTENYMEKLFYFCLKKTGNQMDAEDLTQDIALQIITALNKGVIPESFSAWVWQIARNRYCVWAKKKHDRAESVTGADIGDYEIEDESENPAGVLDEMVHSAQMALLRRELAFIRSDYRGIVVAYYIENKSVREIASSLNLSESAVKQRLHRARKILKEGMDMKPYLSRVKCVCLQIVYKAPAFITIQPETSAIRCFGLNHLQSVCSCYSLTNNLLYCILKMDWREFVSRPQITKFFN